MTFWTSSLYVSLYYFVGNYCSFGYKLQTLYKYTESLKGQCTKVQAQGLRSQHMNKSDDFWKCISGTGKINNI